MLNTTKRPNIIECICGLIYLIVFYRSMNMVVRLCLAALNSLQNIVPVLSENHANLSGDFSSVLKAFFSVAFVYRQNLKALHHFVLRVG